MSELGAAVRQVEQWAPLPRCAHNHALRAHAGERLEPPCGCRALRPLLVGESNPYGSDPRYALYPKPAGCSGERLCRVVLGLRAETYLAAFQRANLLIGPAWSAPLAREAAGLLLRYDWPVVATLGRRVLDAFKPYVSSTGPVVIALPHPSGRNRAWNEPGMVERCREELASYLPDVPLGEVDGRS